MKHHISKRELKTNKYAKKIMTKASVQFLAAYYNYIEKFDSFICTLDVVPYVERIPLINLTAEHYMGNTSMLGSTSINRINNDEHEGH